MSSSSSSSGSSPTDSEASASLLTSFFHEILSKFDYKPWVASTFLSVSVFSAYMSLYAGRSLWRDLCKIDTLLILPDQGESSLLIQKTWEKAITASTITHVVVVTSNDQTAEGCREFGADVLVTIHSCENGIHRCIQVLSQLPKYKILINVEGDGRLIDPKIIDKIKIFQEAPNAESVKCVDLKMLTNGGIEMKAITVERPKLTTPDTSVSTSDTSGPDAARDVQNQRSTYFDWVPRMFSTSANDDQNQPPPTLDATPEVSTPETSNPGAVEDVRSQLSTLLDNMMFKMLSTSNPDDAEGVQN